MAWYYIEAGDRKGPIEDDVLEEYVDSGRILSSTKVWQEGMTYWTEYGRLLDQPSDGADSGLPSAVRELCTLCEKTCTPADLMLFENHRVCPECKPHFVQRLKEGTLPTTGRQYGGFWVRFVAYTIDTMVVIIPMAIAGIVFSMLLLPLMVNDEPVAILLFYLMLLGLQHGVPALYEIVMIKQYGATLGKMVFNLKVIDGHGNTPGWWRSTGRHFAKYLNQFTCNLSLVIVAFDKEKRAVQDHLCNTRVIRS